MVSAPKNTYDTTFKGLSNNQGNNNCFLNVVIQSLWHLGSFRSHFLATRLHFHSERELFLRKRRQEIARQSKQKKIKLNEEMGETV